MEILANKRKRRIYAIANAEYDFDEAVNALQHVFGIGEFVLWFRLKIMDLKI